jgi:hypothetical protein
MSEFTPAGHEPDKFPEQTSESYRPDQERPAENKSRPKEAPKLDIEAIRQKVLEQPEAPLELPIDASPEGDQPAYIDRAMKRVSLNNELNLIRAKLTPGQHILSRGVHQPTIRQVSDISARTITRPIGLLGGGVLAFCGSLIYLLFSKYVGLRYNYLVFIMLFIIGYLLATAIEFLFKATRLTKED